MNLNPNCFYENGNFTGLLDKSLRTPDVNGKEALRALITAIKTVATADGTIANVVTAATNLETEFNTAATFNKVVAPF